MPDTKSKKIFASLLLAVTSWILLIGAFNVVIDPYAVIGTPLVKNLNKDKPEFSTLLSQAKLRKARSLSPGYIILGNSRADRGIDPSHPGWLSRDVYNMAIPGSSIQDIYQQLAFIARHTKTKKILVDLDFPLMFNAFVTHPVVGPKPEYILESKQETIFSASVFSMNSLYSSIKTISRQNQQTQYSIKGNMVFDRSSNRRESTYLNEFKRGEKSFLSSLAKSKLTSEDRANLLTYFEKLLDTAYGNEMEIIFLLSPYHSWMNNWLTSKEIEKEFELWKNSLKQINRDVAYKNAKAEYKLWDFTACEKRCDENVPTIGKMQWHQNYSHYSVDYGDFMLSCVLSEDSKKCEKYILQ